MDFSPWGKGSISENVLVIRNLVYYVFPIRGSIWNWNVDKVLKYWDGFTGRKIICITTDEATEKAETVKDKFASHGAEFLIDQNDPRLCETKTFIPALSLLESQRGDEITFYAHAKGVTRSGEVLTHVQSWADGMYEVNLRYLDVIDRILSKYSSAGCFLHESVNHAWSDWHYSGTFFWFKHSALFSKNWKKI